MALLPLGNVVLLLHCDDAAGSTTLIDSTSYAQTAKCYGTCASSAAQSKFGGSAAKTGNANGNFFAVGANQTLDFGTDDFTVETWLYPVSQGADGGAILGRWDGTHNDFLLVRNGDGSMGVLLNGALLLTTAAGDLPLNTWTHVALVRLGGLVTAYVGGADKGDAAFASAINWTHGVPLYFGQGNQAGGATWLEAYYDEIRVSNGKAQYTGPFTPPTAAFGIAGDPYFANVSLLLHCDDSVGGTFYTDSSTWGHTTASNVAVSATSPKFGSGCADCSARSDPYIDVTVGADSTFGTGDFTIELWVKVLGAPAAYGTFIDFRPTGTNGAYPALFVQSDLSVLSFLNNGNALVTSSKLTLNTWTHVALVRSGTAATLYINGVSAGSYADSNTYPSVSRVRLGRSGWASATDLNLNGLLDEVRVTKGVARYIGNFTPPSTPFPNSAGSTSTDSSFSSVSLLLHCDGGNGSTAFLDSSPQGLGIAVSGSAAVSTTQSKFGGAALSLPGTSALRGTSYGAALRINAPATSFTVECWAYLNSTNGDPYLVSANDSSNSQRWAMQVYSGKLAFFNGSGAPTAGSIAIPTGSWAHLAVCYDATTSVLKLFVNGAQDLSTTLTMNTGTNPVRAEIGAAYFNSSNYVNGYLDDIRITKGVARYTGAFALPTAPFPDSGPPVQVLRTVLKPAYLRPRFFLPNPAKAQIRLYKPNISRLRDQIFGGTGKVAGTVDVAPSTPVSRKLWLLDERCLVPIRSTWSDPVTGAYQFSYIDASRTYTVVGYDYTKTYRAVIANGAIPDSM